MCSTINHSPKNVESKCFIEDFRANVPRNPIFYEVVLHYPGAMDLAQGYHGKMRIWHMEKERKGQGAT
jgi:hypothetical protein